MMSKILDTYIKNTPGSAAAQARAERGVVGGNSRAAAYWKPYPLTMERASGTSVFDVDGNEYIDIVNNYTSLVHSHGYPPVIEAVSKQLAKGTAWNANNTWQMELAETLIERIPAMDSIRFANSGSEAGILALTIARAVTGRNKLLMAKYGYHGILLEYEVGTYPGLIPQCEGSTYIGKYNDPTSFEQILAEHGDEIAAVVLEPTSPGRLLQETRADIASSREPVVSAGGFMSSTHEFLCRVKAAANAAGALFILDEVVTFRLAEGGVQTLYDIEPDLTQLGKVIGGGFPVGAVGGKLEHMKVFDLDAPKAMHSGTFCGNPVSMAAGVVSVRELTAERIDRMDVLAARLSDGLTKHASNLKLPLSINHRGSLLNLFFADTVPGEPKRQNAKLLELFFIAALNHGLMLADRGVMVLSTVMDKALIDTVVQRAAAAMEDVVDEMDEVVGPT